MKVNNVFRLNVDFDNPEAELMAIKQCATYVRRRLSDLAAAEAWIACGESLANLKKGLIKDTPRGDNRHIGWAKAFELQPRQFPFGRQHADKLIKIFEFFTASGGAVKKLPGDFKALLALATCRFSAELLSNCLSDGSLTPGSTEREVMQLAKRLKLIKKKPKPEPKALPKRERVQQVWDLMARLGLKIEDLTSG